MKDFRLYADTIKKAVARERAADSLWSWRVKAITKKAVRISWEYLEQIGSRDTFTVKFATGAEDSAEDLIYTTRADGAAGSVCEDLDYDWGVVFVGPDRWHDACDLEHAIPAAVHALGNMARNTF